MKTTFVILVLIAGLGLIASGQSFTPIDLSPIANFKIDRFTNPPSGHKKFGNIPFELPESGRAFRTEGRFVKATMTVKLATNVPHPTAVYVLLSGTYVKHEFENKKVGEITLAFADGSEATFPIKAWRTIRETWAYDDEIQEPSAQGNPKLINVYAESQKRGDRAATAFLDMLEIDLGQTKLATNLSSISINDTSRDTVEDVAPSIEVSGITIRHE